MSLSASMIVDDSKLFRISFLTSEFSEMLVLLNILECQSIAIINVLIFKAEISLWSDQNIAWIIIIVFNVFICHMVWIFVATSFVWQWDWLRVFFITLDHSICLTKTQAQLFLLTQVTHLTLFIRQGNLTYLTGLTHITNSNDLPVWHILSILQSWWGCNMEVCCHHKGHIGHRI